MLEIRRRAFEIEYGTLRHFFVEPDDSDTDLVIEVGHGSDGLICLLRFRPRRFFRCLFCRLPAHELLFRFCYRPLRFLDRCFLFCFFFMVLLKSDFVAKSDFGFLFYPEFFFLLLDHGHHLIEKRLGVSVRKRPFPCHDAHLQVFSLCRPSFRRSPKARPAAFHPQTHP